jgi:cytochrome P450
MHGAARHLSRDAEFDGVTMRKGEPVYMAWSAANRDADIFDNPDEIDLTRFPNRHVAFGAGPHRCIGSFMARVAFEEMMKLILEHIPDYVLHVERAELYPSIGTINGWINMPATFAPRARISEEQG